MRPIRLRVVSAKWSSSSKSKWAVEGLRNPEGKRVRKFFPTRDAADEWLRGRRGELVVQGRSAVTLTDRERVDATQALAILRPFGASLTQAAQAFAERAKLLSRTVSFAQLREEIVAAKKADRKSSVYLSDLINRLRKVGEAFDEKPVATIESREIDDWLRGLNLAPGSRKNYRKVLQTTFEFAVTRGYARENPVTKTARVKVSLGPPGILLPREIAALLAVSDTKIIPAVAIAAFAGLRDAEIARLTWDKVDLVSGFIKVDASIAKTASRRLVPISENLKCWLAPHALTSGPVRLTFRPHYELFRKARLAAFKLLAESGVQSPSLQSWPSNALRHSFSSYRMALVGNPATVAEEAGHSVQIMKTHYRELVSKSDAEAWFNISPRFSEDLHEVGDVSCATG